MKKLILLLLFIPLVSCDSIETKENVYSFGEDTWLKIDALARNEYKEIDITRESDLDRIDFIEFKGGELHNGFYDYSIWHKELDKEYNNKEDYYFEDEKMTVLANQFEEGKTVYYSKLDWKNNDSIYGKLISVKENGIETLEKENVGIDFFLLLRKPKYSNEDARGILTKKKNDLDLQLITQKQYDSIKNKLSRYISD
jgi:hypothetical protein